MSLVEPDLTPLIDVLRPTLTEQAPGEFRQMLKSATVPPTLVEQIATLLLEHPALATMNAQQVIAAAWQINPEYARLLDSPMGREWMGAVARAVVFHNATKIVSSFFGLAR